MPLVRVQVRNEYGLGRPELYRETNSEDPKVVLDGVVVAGLVGILRQLGDLADFAAEVFHGLQEQVLTTASRSRKLMLRAQNIEASLPPLEKAILAQTSHIHFAYTAGCEWHSRAKPEQNHFIYNNLPQFLMDSYEECRDPPCLHLLDKFDPGGSGSCLRRYSDPTFFKRVSADSDEAHIKKTERSRKTSRIKKKRLPRNGETLQGEQMHTNGGRKTYSSQTDDVVRESDLEDHSYSVDSRDDVGHRKSSSRRNGETLQGEQMHSNDGRMQFASHVNGQTSSSQTADVGLESDLKDHSYSVDSRADAGYIECVFQPSNSMQFDEQECKESPSSRLTQKIEALQSASPTIDYNFSQGSFDKQIASTCTGLTWDEKEEIVDSESQWRDRDELAEVLDETHNLHMHEDEPVAPENSDQSDILYGEERNLKPVFSRVQTDETDSEPDNYLDALNTIESESENDLDCETKEEAEQFASHVSSEVMENGVGATSTDLDHDFYNFFSHTISSVSLNKGTDLDSPETQEIPHISEEHVTSLRNPVQSDVPDNIERTKILVASYDSESPIHELVPDICGNSVLDCSVGPNPLDDTCSLNDKMPSSTKTVPSNAPVNIESKTNLVDSHGSESPAHEQERAHQPANYVLGCPIGTDPLDDVHILDDAVPVSIEPVQSNVIVNRERTENLGDASEYPIGEQVPRIRGNSVFDNAHNDSLSASTENVGPDSFVNSETTYNLADTHAPQSPIHEQVSHVCSVCDNAHNDSLSASTENVRPDGFVNSEATKNLAGSHTPQSPVHEEVSLVCSASDNARNDSLSASTENFQPDGFVNSEKTNDLADSHAPQSPVHEEGSHVCSFSDNARNDSLSASSENVRPDGFVNSEKTNDLADSHAPQSPVHEEGSHVCSFSDNARNDSLSASSENVGPDGFVNSETNKNLADIHAPQSPVHEEVSHVCSASDNAHNDSLSASTENFLPDGFVNSEMTNDLADSHAPQSPVHEEVSHICSVSDNAHNDSLSASSENVGPDGFVNSETTKNLADSHAPQSPVHEEVSHVCSASDNAHNDSLSAFTENFQPDGFVNSEMTNDLADSHAPQSPVHEEVSHICSVSDHAYNDSLSASSENVRPDGFVNSEKTNDLADSHAPQSPVHEEGSHVCSFSDNARNDSLSASSENVGPDGFVNSETNKNLADIHAPQSPVHEEVSHVCSASDNAHNDSLSASTENFLPDGFVNSEMTNDLADSHAPQSPVHEEVSHICSVSDHAHNDSLSASSENVGPDGFVNSETTKNLADTHAPQSPIHEQVSHVCSVLDNAQNDSLSASIENVGPDGFVNSETTKNLADSPAPQSPIHEQVSHVGGNSVLECSAGTNPLGDYPPLNDSVSASIEIDPSDDPVNFERTMNFADSHGSVSTIHEQLPHISGNSVLNCLGGTNPLGDAHTLHDTVLASIGTDISSGSKSSDLPDKEADSIDGNVYKSKATPSGPASDPSVGLWTNGGLLGLEPSKPPDFIMPSSLNQGSMTSTNDTDGVSNHNSMLKSNGYREEQDLSKIAELNQKEPSSRFIVSQYADQACISGKTSECHWQSSRHALNDDDFDKNRVPTPGTVVPVAHTGCTEPIKGSGLNSPLLFGLGHKLLINSFCRKVSFEEKSGPDDSVKTGLLEQNGQNSTVQQSLPETTFKEQVSYDYPICSPPPSPPLEHMKISFCPVDGFETFKLKLKFPDVSNHSESTRDMFPSFRLVPEYSILVHDSGSNSDDNDTFCKSVSDDCLSPHSDYNSDQWESDDTPDISGDGVYDSSHRRSLIESKSNSQEVRGVTNDDINLDSEHVMLTQDSAEPTLSVQLLEFPSFDTMNPVLGKECNKHSDYDNNLKLQGHAESIPPAPPLPPNQWWLSNQRSDMMNEKQNCMSKGTEKSNDLNTSESTLQVRPTSMEQNPTDHEDHEFNEDIPRKLRDKSFSQKHKATGKPNRITSPTTTDKVAAILEKANAVRQVISSDDDDDDDDDSWSEI